MSADWAQPIWQLALLPPRISGQHGMKCLTGFGAAWADVGHRERARWEAPVPTLRKRRASVSRSSRLGLARDKTDNCCRWGGGFGSLLIHCRTRGMGVAAWADYPVLMRICPERVISK
jgi:hypothetical protein